jgi:hypothetical protein
MNLKLIINLSSIHFPRFILAYFFEMTHLLKFLSACGRTTEVIPALQNSTPPMFLLKKQKNKVFYYLLFIKSKTSKCVIKKLLNL